MKTNNWKEHTSLEQVGQKERKELKGESKKKRKGHPKVVSKKI
jgi:hypothetical protein